MSKIFLIFFMVGALILAVINYEGQKYERFMETAKQTDGWVVSKEKRQPRQKVQRREKWVTYSYKDSDGTQFTSEEAVEYADLWNDFQTGQPLKVYYNPQKPEESHLSVVLDRRLGIHQSISQNSQ